MVEKERPESVEDLKLKIRKVWDDLTIEYLQKLIESMPIRIKECIEAKGEKQITKLIKINLFFSIFNNFLIKVRHF